MCLSIISLTIAFKLQFIIIIDHNLNLNISSYLYNIYNNFDRKNYLIINRNIDCNRVHKARKEK
jgi:hypothetical protein